MKYDKELYIDSGFYGLDEDLENHKEKIVKCRKPHKCASCEKEINVGEQALYESGFSDGEPASSYTCLPCIEEWLEESGQVEVEEERVCATCFSGELVKDNELGYKVFCKIDNLYHEQNDECTTQTN